MVVIPWFILSRYILGHHRLITKKLPKLGLSREELESDLDISDGQKESENDKIFYEYEYGWHHILRVWFDDDGKSQRYVFVSRRSSPKSDLSAVMNAYSDGKSWDAIEPGYLYLREDRKCQVNCSIMPIIGVCLINQDSA